MNVATVASDTAWKDVDKNVELTHHHVAKVKQMHPSVDVILFPEISLAGFIVDASNADVAEPLTGSAVQQIKDIARKNNVALICGIVEENPGGKPFNTQFVVSKDGELIASYRKNHLFTQSAEPEVYTAGAELITFDLGGWKCGLSTCFDIRFPRLFEAYKSAGVQVLFSGFNWVNGRNKPEIMENLVKARAHENQYFMVAVDRSGSDPNTTFYGKSFIVNPFAEDIAVHDDVYSYAELEKDEIINLSRQLPLVGSFKDHYEVTSSPN